MNLQRSYRKFFPTILLLIIVLILVGCFALLEAFLDIRYERWKSRFASEWDSGLSTISENPILMWENHPYATFKNSPIIQTNRFGFRDYDYESRTKPADIFRISFVGDSVTFGLKVDSKNKFTSKFADYASEEYPAVKIQAMNHGVPGYNALQVSELLASRVLRFEPDKVVYVMCLNDFNLEGGAGGVVRYFKKPDSFVLKRSEEVYRRLRRNLLKRDFHLWYFEKNKHQVFEELLEMKQLLRERDIGFQVVVLPVFRSKFWDSDESFWGYPLTEMHDEIRRFLTREDIDFIDLLEPFSNQGRPPEYFSDDLWHPNEEGHEFIAKQLVKFVMAEI